MAVFLNLHNTNKRKNIYIYKLTQNKHVYSDLFSVIAIVYFLM